MLDAAEAVLAANWRDGSTVPSGRQYPHQWGWDAAYIAIGWSWVDPARAAAELESLLRGQWDDGRVPHIVFHADVPEDAYFPGPAFWDSDVGGVATSGLTQPPLHARAALEVARRGAGEPFLRRVFGRLVAQHEYQHNETILQTLQLKLGAPYSPPLRVELPVVGEGLPSAGMVRFPGGRVEIGTADRSEAYDNERPRHTVELRPFDVDVNPVTNGEYLGFMEAGVMS